MKTINKFLTGAVSMTAFALMSCSGGTTGPEAGKGAEQANAGGNQEVKTYKVGTNPVFAPFEFTTEAGDIVGFDIDVMNAIAKDRNVKFTYKNLPWDGIFASLESGDVDALAAAITITDDRKQRMDFTEPYYEVTQVIVLPKGKQINSVEELKNLGKIGVVSAQTGDILMQQYLGPTSSKIARYDTLPLMFKEIQAGGADAGVSDSAAILYYMKSNPEVSGYSLVMFDDFPIEKYGMAVNKGNTELLELINTGLKNIKADGTYDKILGKYFSEQENKQLAEKVGMAVDDAKATIGQAAEDAKDKTAELAERTGDKLDQLKQDAGEALENAKDKTMEAGRNLKDKAGELYDKAGEKTSDAVDATKDAMSNAADKTREMAHDAAEATGDAAQAAKEKAGQAYDATKEAAHDAAEATKDAAGAAVDKTKEVAHDAAEATKDAAGAAVDKTKEVAHDAAEATKDAARAVKDKAAQAVDAVKQATHDAAEKVSEATE